MSETAEPAPRIDESERPPLRTPGPQPITLSQKAAIIIAVLGADGAKPIVDKLDDEAMKKVAGELESISYLSRREILEVVAEFVESLEELQGGLRAGPERAKDIVAQIFGANRLKDALGEAGVEQAGGAASAMAGDATWQRFAQRDDEDIAAYLCGLPASIAAMILRQLDAATTSSALARFDDDALRSAVERLIAEQPSDPGVAHALERMVQIEFLNNSGDADAESEESLSKLGEVFSLLPDEKREPVVDFLRREHEDKLFAIEKSMLTVEGLPDILPRNAVPALFREIERGDLIAFLSSLKARHEGVLEFLLTNISSRMADQFKDELEDVSPPGEEDAALAQRKIVSQILDMKRRGLVVVQDTGHSAGQA